MTWICKKCGQIQPDSIIYGDEICDDCFEKMKKKKKKGSAFNKILSLALVLSFMLCIFSGFGIASAAEVGTQSEIELYGSYMDYDVIKFDIEQRLSILSIKAIYDKYFPTFDVNNHLAMFLFEFDENGNPLFYCTYGRYGNPGGFTWEMYAVSETAHYLAMTSYSAIAEDMGVRYNYIDVRYNATHTILCHQDVGSTSESGAPYSIDMVNGVHGAYSGSFVSDTRYLLFAPYNSNETDGHNILPTLLNGTRDSDFTVKGKNTYTAKFHSFASMNDTSQSVLNLIDWLGLGNQYPTVDFSINDNGNHHSYSLRISTNSNYTDVCMSAWEDYKNKQIESAVGNVAGIVLTATLGQALVTSSLGPLGLCLITVPTDNYVVDAIRRLEQIKLLNSLDNLSYTVEYNLTNQYLQFNEGESSSRSYSVCLADYLTIVKGLVYKLEIVDNNTGLILDKAFFCNDTTFHKANTGYGCKVNHYSDYDSLIKDFENDNKFNDSDNYVQGDDLHSDNNDDIIDWDKYNQYDFTNIQNLTGTLNSATAGLGGFFMACFNVIPPAFISILLGTFTLVIILRVLGR